MMILRINFGSSLDLLTTIIIALITSKLLLAEPRTSENKPLKTNTIPLQDDKLPIYTRLFSTDKLADLLERDDILDSLKEGRKLEEATPNGGRTTMESDLIKLGSEIDSDRCLQINLFPKINWLKRKFSETPQIFEYLQQIESEQVDLCRESFPSDYAMTMVKLSPKLRFELRELTKKVGSMGVYLSGAGDIAEMPLVNGVVAYIMDMRRRKDSGDLAGLGQIGDDGLPITRSSNEQQQPKLTTQTSSLSSLTREQSNQLTNEFIDNYKQLASDCKLFTNSISPLMQVAQAVGDQVLDLDSTLRDLQKDNVVCLNVIRHPQLLSKMGELYMNRLAKERKIRPLAKLDSAPKSGPSPTKKSIFGSFKFKLHRSS